MKKYSISRFYGLCASLVLNLATLQSSAQDLTASVGTPYRIHTEASIITKTPVAVNAKVMDSFNQSFAGVNDLLWEASGNMYYAHFQLADRQALAAFRKNGRIDHTVLYGTEKHLPLDVSSVVRANFPDHTITATQYVVKYNVGTWVVTIENKKEIYKVAVKGDDVDVLENLKKAK